MGNFGNLPAPHRKSSFRKRYICLHKPPKERKTTSYLHKKDLLFWLCITLFDVLSALDSFFDYILHTVKVPITYRLQSVRKQHSDSTLNVNKNRTWYTYIIEWGNAKKPQNMQIQKLQRQEEIICPITFRQTLRQTKQRFEQLFCDRNLWFLVVFDYYANIGILTYITYKCRFHSSLIFF